MPIDLTPESIQGWLAIGAAIVSGGAELVNKFKQFLKDNNIEHDNSVLDAQISDDESHIAHEETIKDS